MMRTVCIMVAVVIAAAGCGRDEAPPPQTPSATSDTNLQTGSGQSAGRVKLGPVTSGKDGKTRFTMEIDLPDSSNQESKPELQ